jgi:hypothetical protein
VIRGNFDWQRVRLKEQAQLRDFWDRPIQGQVIGVDPKQKLGFIREPIHEVPELLRRIRERGMDVGPEVEEFPNIDVNAWLYWMKRAVDEKKAYLLTGEFPDNLTPPGAAKRRDRVFRGNPQLAAQWVGWSDKERQEFEALVGI